MCSARRESFVSSYRLIFEACATDTQKQNVSMFVKTRIGQFTRHKFLETGKNRPRRLVYCFMMFTRDFYEILQFKINFSTEKQGHQRHRLSLGPPSNFWHNISSKFSEKNYLISYPISSQMLRFADNFAVPSSLYKIEEGKKDWISHRRTSIIFWTNRLTLEEVGKV